MLRSRELGFVFQSSFVLGDAPTLENAALGLRIQGMPIRERGRLAEIAVRKLGLGQKTETLSRLLSGGERQRLAIARAIATVPSVILADEPAGNLDSKNASLVMEHLRELNAQGVTVILVTHDAEIAATIPRRIRIVDGRIESDETDLQANACSLDRDTYAESRATSRKFVVSKERLLDDLADAFSALTQKIGRASLLVPAFTLGIAGVVSAIGVSESAAAQVSARLSEAALDDVRVFLPADGDLLGDGYEKLEGWVERASSVAYVDSVAYEARAPAKSVGISRFYDDRSQENTSELFLMATSSNYLDVVGSTDRLISKSFSSINDSAVRNVAWVVEEVSNKLGVPQPGPGSSLWIGQQRVEVTGSLHSLERAPHLNRTVIVSPDVVAASSELQVMLIVRTQEGFPSAVAEALPLAMDPSNPGQFSIETVADLRDLRHGVSNDLGAFVGMLAIVVLVLVSISASATMYLSVQSRTAEIALRRAIGTSRAAVGRLFLAEGMIIGVIGGALGGFLGTAAVITVSVVQGWPQILPPYLVPAAMISGVAAGFLSALIPALSASRKDPATAIRG